ncbi:hypothetical protein Shal_3384 [Shewanella halifaxensis HAW-EB4]|uniref:Uncharacterized protein n=1 Tax=Shewanella halifaxensis (strain HAW-EB4) TaxID=458817 RepID=B0TSH6_SHEHH|nr:hypothetical protein Shal_3384 [Shewanella halifaxensis HAW-EB4]
MMAGVSFNTSAGLDEKIAASFAAKYEVCAVKLKVTPGYKLKALGLKIKADEIGRDKVSADYVKAFVKEKKKAWTLPLRKCQKFADRL